jgi:hypothetical protein
VVEGAGAEVGAVTGDSEDRVDLGDAAGETNGDAGVVEGVAIEAAEVGAL